MLLLPCRYIVCCILPGLQLGDSKIRRQFIQIQTYLHDKHCDHRRLATIGSHDMAKVGHVGCLYEAQELDEIEFVPLGMDREMTAEELVEHYRAHNPNMAQYVSSAEGPVQSCMQRAVSGAATQTSSPARTHACTSHPTPTLLRCSRLSLRPAG